MHVQKKEKMSDEKISARPLPPLPSDPDTDDYSSESDDSSAHSPFSPSDPFEYQVVCDVLFAERHGDADDTDDEENVVLAELEGKK